MLANTRRIIIRGLRYIHGLIIDLSLKPPGLDNLCKGNRKEQLSLDLANDADQGQKSSECKQKQAHKIINTVEGMIDEDLDSHPDSTRFWDHVNQCPRCCQEEQRIGKHDTEDTADE